MKYDLPDALKFQHFLQIYYRLVYNLNVSCQINLKKLRRNEGSCVFREKKKALHQFRVAPVRNGESL